MKLQKWVDGVFVARAGRWSRSRPGAPWILVGLLGAGLVAVVCVLPACESSEGPFGERRVDRGGERVGPLGPDMRVRVVRGAGRVSVGGPGRVLVIEPRPMERSASGQMSGVGIVLASAGREVTRDPVAGSMGRRLRTPVAVRAARGGLLEVSERGGRWARIDATVVAFQSDSGALLSLGGVEYPGRLMIHGVVPTDGTGSPRVDVVNHVPMEQYLPGVLHRELYQSWSAAAFEAQAVAARSYALYQHRVRLGRSRFDMESTQASQVYGGAGASRRARAAVRDTRGWVLMYGGGVLPAYYSSCCGGRGQDASAAFPHGMDEPVFHGRAHGRWCAASSKYRWGPVKRSRLGLSRRLVAWGKDHKHPVKGLRVLAAVEVTGRNRAGRPTRFRVRGLEGGAYELAAEVFRHACNFKGKSVPDLARDAVLSSSDVFVKVEGARVIFHGRGYGHGVGMCQWGAQGMAQDGRGPAEILGYFYPGASLKPMY